MVVIACVLSVARKQGSDPTGREEKDDMEHRIVVLGVAALVVVWRVALVLVVFIIRQECVSRQATFLDSTTQSFSPHLSSTGLLCHESMLVIVLGQSDSTPAVSKAEALRSCACSGVGDRQHRHNCADDDGCLACALSTNQGIAMLVVGFHGDGGHGEVRAVDGNDGGLGKTGLGVVLLHRRMHRQKRDSQPE